MWRFPCREMWFIYLLSWLSLVIQISFVTLAIGKCLHECLLNAGANVVMLADPGYRLRVGPLCSSIQPCDSVQIAFTACAWTLVVASLH